MNKLTDVYKKILSEALLGEERIEFNQLDNDIILFDYDNLFVLISTKDIVIPKNEIIQHDHLLPYVLGTVDYNEVTSNTNEIVAVAAKKGYGLLMYELAMQKSYPKGIVSLRSGNTKDGAFRLYRYYHENLNPNVYVRKISENEAEYKSCVDKFTSQLGCEDDGVTPLKPELMDLYNSVLYMKPKEYNILKNRSKKFLKLYGEDFEDAAITAGEMFFDDRY